MAGKSKSASYRIEPLGAHHDRTAFCCGNPPLDSYLHQQAGQDQKRKLAAIFALTADRATIAGYYTLSAHSIQAAELPPEQAKQLPRYPLPVTLLARLAVALPLHGQGLGEFLLLDALERSCRGSLQVASWAVVVDAKAGGRDFYLKHDFMPLQTHPDRLFLPMKTIEKIFEN